MDTKVGDAKIMPIVGDLEHQKAAILGDGKDSESETLLPAINGEVCKGQPNTRRKVHWKDTYGNKLAEVLEFQPSDASDSDEDDADSCFCTIM